MYRLRVDSTSTNDRTNWVTISDGLTQLLEVEACQTICATIAICSVVESVACSGWRENTSFHRTKLLLRTLHKIRSGHDSCITLSGIKCGASLVQTVQGGRASCVESKATYAMSILKTIGADFLPRTRQIESMTNSVRQDGSSHSCGMIAVKIVRVSCLHHPVVKGEGSDEDSNGLSTDLVQADAGILKTLIRELEKLSLLRVHESRLDVVDPEEAVLKLAQIFMNEVA